MIPEETINIGSLKVYYVQNERGTVITYAEQAGEAYILDDEEAEEITEAIERMVR